MSDLAAVLVGFGIGAVITFVILWSERDALRRGLRQRRAELFGEESITENVTGSSSSTQASEKVGEFRHRQLAVAVCVVAVIGSAFVAGQTSDETVRVVNIALCAILAAGGGMLLFRRTG
jgi:hypothetical protein